MINSLFEMTLTGYLGTPLGQREMTVRQQSQLMAALLDELDIDNVAVIGVNGTKKTISIFFCLT
jgi:hypothetical protein